MDIPIQSGRLDAFVACEGGYKNPCMRYSRLSGKAGKLVRKAPIAGIPHTKHCIPLSGAFKFPSTLGVYLLPNIPKFTTPTTFFRPSAITLII